MNWLSHVLLAGPDVEMRLGGILADVLGPAALATLGPGVQRGAALHQALDVFTDEHPAVLRAQRRLWEFHRRLAPVLSDVFLDHVLSARWPEFVPDALPLQEFTRGVYAQFTTWRAARPEPLPPPAGELLDHLVAENWLGSYGTPDGLRATLARLERRLRGRFVLVPAVDWLASRVDDFATDLREFFPDAACAAEAWHATLPAPSSTA